LRSFERRFTVDAMSADLLRVLQQGMQDGGEREGSLALGRAVDFR